MGSIVREIRPDVLRRRGYWTTTSIIGAPTCSTRWACADLEATVLG